MSVLDSVGIYLNNTLEPAESVPSPKVYLILPNPPIYTLILHTAAANDHTLCPAHPVRRCESILPR